MLSAIFGPMPSTLRMSSALASISASRLRKCAASSCATSPPTWRMPRAKSRRCRLRSFDASMFFRILSASPVAHALQREQLVFRQGVDVGEVLDEAALEEYRDPALAEAFDVHAPRRRSGAIQRKICAGQELFGQ